jgi:hypothetical protein
MRAIRAKTGPALKLLAFLVCLSLLSAGLRPFHFSGKTEPECRDAMQAFQVPCFVGCAITAPGQEALDFLFEPEPETCCFPEAETNGQGPAPGPCFCCSDPPLTKASRKVLLTESHPGQRVPAVPARDLLTPLPAPAFREGSCSDTVSLSDHLPLRSTVVIIV